MFETDRSTESRFHLAGNVKMVEDRLGALIEFYYFSTFRSDNFQIMPHIIVYATVIDLNRSKIRVQYISNDSQCTTHLLAYKTNRFLLLERFYCFLPAFYKQSQFVV